MGSPEGLRHFSFYEAQPRRGGQKPQAGAREMKGVVELLERQRRRAGGGGGAARGDHAGTGGVDHGAELR
jgi:hypothetical protein